MEKFVEFECPLIFLVVDNAPFCIFRNVYGHRLSVCVDIDVFGSKVRGGSGADHHFDRFFFSHIGDVVRGISQFE